MSVLEKPVGEIEETHDQERIEYVECGKCEATYLEIVDLVAHMNTDHNDLVHYCLYCKIVYRGNQKSFDEHEKSHIFEVSEDDKIAESIGGFLNVKEKPSTLEEKEEEEKPEEQDKMEQKFYNCDLCDKHFEKKYDLRRHINTHDTSEYIENNEEIEILKNAKIIVENRCLYECNTCAKHIVTKRGFLRHIRIHTGNRPCRCTICGNQYRIKQDLARHIRDVHDRIKKYQCEICARPFANKGAKEDHQRIHTGERPYSCKLCKKTFRTLNSIYIHNRIHTNYKPHKCPTCDKQFPSRQRLNNHLTTHTGVKEFSCEICFKLFSVKGEVVRHRAIHSQDKPFVCTSCGMKFGQKRYLRNHIKQHHKEQSSFLLAKLTEAPH